MFTKIFRLRFCMKPSASQKQPQMRNQISTRVSVQISSTYFELWLIGDSETFLDPSDVPRERTDSSGFSEVCHRIFSLKLRLSGRGLVKRRRTHSRSLFVMLQTLETLSDSIRARETQSRIGRSAHIAVFIRSKGMRRPSGEEKGEIERAGSTRE